MSTPRLLAATLAACLVMAGCATTATPGAPRSTSVSPDAALAAATPTATGALGRALAVARPGATIRLGPGHYYLEPAAYTDPSCGNCENASDTVPATLGLRISGTGIRIEGVHRDSVIIHTRAGYGLLFEDCDDCALSGVSVTGGIRDADGRATDAAIVVRRSTVAITDCAVRDNIGDSATVMKTIVGIAGFALREGSNARIERCDIRRNSWDGIAMYRGARAEITDNVVDGVDKAAGSSVGGGRGVGIGLTWDAQAIVRHNLVRRYWKGIGVFVNADAAVSENIVEDILTWGITLWAPDSGTATARIERNIVYRTGACGVMVDRRAASATPGALVDNVVIRTGQNARYDNGTPYCWQRPI
ncbi:MAG TPA: right-handed parallel beta-helix repeat-containing protein, partial [Longimicrobiales bacterium]|nr:right-handed parallel beta-helix repeat-containing protein [Longimicrobiales bacterium]